MTGIELFCKLRDAQYKALLRIGVGQRNDKEIHKTGIHNSTARCLERLNLIQTSPKCRGYYVPTIDGWAVIDVMEKLDVLKKDEAEVDEANKA